MISMRAGLDDEQIQVRVPARKTTSPSSNEQHVASGFSAARSAASSVGNATSLDTSDTLDELNGSAGVASTSVMAVFYDRNVRERMSPARCEPDGMCVRKMMHAPRTRPRGHFR